MNLRFPSWWPKWWLERVRHWHIAYRTAGISGDRIYTVKTPWPNSPDLNGDSLRIIRKMLVKELRGKFPVTNDHGVVITFFKSLSGLEHDGKEEADSVPVREVFPGTMGTLGTAEFVVSRISDHGVSEVDD